MTTGLAQTSLDAFELRQRSLAVLTPGQVEAHWLPSAWVGVYVDDGNRQFQPPRLTDP